MERVKRTRGNSAKLPLPDLDPAAGSEGASEGFIGSPDYIPLLATDLMGRDYLSFAAHGCPKILH
jgi:hypothetical protein